MRLPLLCAAAIIVLPALALPFAPTTTATPKPESAASSLEGVAPSIEAPTLAPTPPTSEAPAGIVGTYDCQGVEPDGTPYRGIVQIVPNQGTFDVIWTFSSGQQYSGLGVMNGDVLAVSYFTNRPGVVAYKIQNGEKGPRLEGQWTVVGANRVFHETLTHVSSEVKRPEPPAAPAPRQPARPLRNSRPA